MEIQKVRDALDNSKRKEARAILAELTEEMRRNEPEVYAGILKRRYKTGPCADACRRFRVANLITTLVLVFTIIAVVGAYILGDFGTGLLVGWGYRYLLAGIVLAAMGILVAAGTFCGRRRAVYIARVLLSEQEKESE